MNRDETRITLIRVAQTLADKYGLSCTEQSTVQNFALGKYLPNPNNEIQNIIWEDDRFKVEFRHRFSYICLSLKYKVEDILAEVEFGRDRDSDNFRLAETLTFKPEGISYLKYLFTCIKDAGGQELLKKVLW